jgi:hypothetical protein
VRLQFPRRPPVFHVLDGRSLAYPKLRGNGVMACLGNRLQNPRIGLLFMDFECDLIGVHVNGDARGSHPGRRAGCPALRITRTSEDVGMQAVIEWRAPSSRGTPNICCLIAEPGGPVK